jgi:hypothetical protein
MYVPVPFAEQRNDRQNESKNDFNDREEKNDNPNPVELNMRAIALAAELGRVKQQLKRVQPQDNFIQQQQAALDHFRPMSRSVIPSPARGLLPELDAVSSQDHHHSGIISASSLLNPLMSPHRTPHPHPPPQRGLPAPPGFLHPDANQALNLDSALMPLITSLASAFERVGEAPAQASEMHGLKILGASAFTDKFTGASFLMKLEGQKKSAPNSPDNYFTPVKLIANISPPPSGCNSASAFSTRTDKFVSKAEWNMVVTSILKANFGIGATDVSAIYDRPTLVTSTGESIEDYSNRFHQASAVCCWAALLTFPGADYRTEHFSNGPPAVHLQSYIQGLPPAVKSTVELAVLLNNQILEDYTKLRRYTIETAKTLAPPGYPTHAPPLPYTAVDPVLIASEEVICYSCRQPGHYANACPSGSPASYGKGKGNGKGGRGKGKGSHYSNPSEPCRNFLAGNCTRGSSCRFLHNNDHRDNATRSYHGERYGSRGDERQTTSPRYNRHYQRDGDRNDNGKRTRERSSSRDREIRAADRAREAVKPSTPLNA